MASITLQGNPINTVGELPETGSNAPDFSLTNGDLEEVSLAAFSGKKKILSLVPSLDTGTCATSAKKFSEAAASLDDTVILNVSADLPFAQARFCESEGAANIIPLSSFRSSFGSDYGAEISDGPLRGLLSRAIIVLDADNKIVHTQQVPEIVDEPDYDSALAASNNA